ncbi:CAP-associated domain-containing protein [Enterococcus sp. HY326]|uniref:CAP-associated domain-containing protein n=1 Tax=Enterococcus sp. HY326 TaxID=2971265 RepID=UPI002240CE7E|nr:CAP-associated domain-containing protein [Enterococcus sp. HY326]
MKKFLGFLAIFAVVLIAFYLEPVFFPPDLASPTDEAVDTLPYNQSLSYETIPTEGFAIYLNQGISRLNEEFGAPIAAQDTGFGYSIATYEDPVRNIFIEANIKNDTVMAIKVAGDSSDRIAPFHFGMDLTDLTSVTTLFSNFDFDYNEQPVSVELSEEDMNYRPLVAFDNDTFAILFFGQQNGQLYGMAYLNQEMLLQIMPYQWNSEPLTGYQTAELADEQWAAIDTANSARGISLVNYLRNLEKLSSYQTDGLLYEQTSQLAAQLKLQPETLLEDAALREWQELQPGVPYLQQQLLNQSDFLETSITSEQWLLAAKPVPDVTFSILNWYSDPYLHNHFIGEDESLAIAFNQEDMVVLLQQQIETKVSDSSDY